LRICKLPVVLRALPPEYVDWLDGDTLTINQVKFFDLVIENGHADYCILCVSTLLYDEEHDVIKARRVLNIASKSKVESAYYFLAMLDAFATGGEDIEKAISNFTGFFQA